jgi:hypothetical protein
MKVSEIITRGVVGLFATGGSVAVSVSTVADQMEVWMRLANLGVGFLVGLASFLSITISIRRKLRKDREKL